MDERFGLGLGFDSERDVGGGDGNGMMGGILKLGRGWLEGFEVKSWDDVWIIK